MTVTQQATPANEQAAIRIGVSKRCCFCCALLGEELNRWGREMASATRAYPEFVLPGRHGIIFPWYPPPGLPVEVLRHMVRRLEEVLRDQLRSDLVADGSAQTSQAMSELPLGIAYNDTPL